MNRVEAEAASRQRARDREDEAEGAERTDARGRDAAWPSEITARGWYDIAYRIWGKVNEDRVLLIAGGVTFYLLLALFPALTAFISTYGLFLDASTVARHVNYLQGLLPAGGLEIIADRIESLATQESGALSFGFAAGFLFAYWSANNGVKALFEALNVAYGEREKRGFIRLNLIAFAFTIGAMVAATLLIGAVGLMPLVLALAGIDETTATVLGLLRWVVVTLLVALGIALLYRFGPSRAPAKWRWISWGSCIATLVWIAGSVGFSFYLQNFGDYEAIYGSLGAVIGLMMWTWISAIILIVGAQINAEMEHQTRRDSTTGRTRPMGRRGAHVADTVGETADGER